MLRRLLAVFRAVPLTFPWLAAVAAGCGVAADREPTGVSHQGIVGGAVVAGAASPVLFLRSPGGSCTAALVAPNLVATVRHCVASGVDGPFSCTPAGDVVLTGSGAGEIGADFAPDQITFVKWTGLSTGSVMSAPADAVGAQILSTGTSTSCRDDLAFVVLAAPLEGVVPLAIRVTDSTRAGESVSVWGYGFTGEAGAATELRVRSDAYVAAIGPTNPMTLTQAAPLRSVLLGPDGLTCSGDSGGPVTSHATGAIVALASLGPAPIPGFPACSSTPVASSGPLLANYVPLVLAAFAAAGVAPNVESDDAGVLGEPHDSGSGPDGTPSLTEPEAGIMGSDAAGGSCSTAATAGRGPGRRAPAILVLALAWSAASARRRRS